MDSVFPSSHLTTHVIPLQYKSHHNTLKCISVSEIGKELRDHDNLKQDMPTENPSERFADIDRWSTQSAVEAMFEAQLSAIAAIGHELATIAQAAEAASRHLMENGRLIYAGAGTSGRIAVQDGVELCPTFGWPTERVAYAIAGGNPALISSVELAEDDAEAAVRDLNAIALNKNDVVIGVAASGRTTYTVSAIKTANANGALTIGISNNRPSPLLEIARIGICAETGSEAIAGSTRMKAGTAQKAILNMFSTATMICCGRVYKGQMVDMVISNQKLRNRAVAMIARLADVEKSVAESALNSAEGNIKVGVLCAEGLDVDAAKQLLNRNHGILRDAVDDMNQGSAIRRDWT